MTLALTAFTALVLAGPVAEAAPTNAPCTDPEYRRLDFWVGDWDAYDADDRQKVVARTRVDVILGGCVLRETYEGTSGLAGESFTIYDAPRKVWHQTWVTNKGQLLTIEGRFRGDRLTMAGGQPSPDGHTMIVRGVWMPEAGGVRETAHTSIDGGSSWRPLFDIFFQRHKTGAAMPDTSEQDLAAAKIFNREEFLRNAARGPDVASYTLVDSRVRLYGHLALVQAIGRFTRHDGTQGTSRYMDVYVLRDGRWKAVSAQITRRSEATGP